MAAGSLTTATRPIDNPVVTIGSSKWAAVHASSGLLASHAATQSVLKRALWEWGPADLAPLDNLAINYSVEGMIRANTVNWNHGPTGYRPSEFHYAAI